MSNAVSIPIKDGQLTDEDFAGEASSPGSSDKRYSKEAKAGFRAIADRVAAQVARGGD